MTDFRNLIDLVEQTEAMRLDELRFPFFRPTAQTEPARVDLSRIDRKPQAVSPEEPTTPAQGKPEVGALFTYQGRTYAVSGYMTEVREAGVFGRRGGRLIACFPSRATWVMGMGGGGAGTVAPITAISLTGETRWTPEAVKSISDKATELVQRRYTIKKPITR